MTYLFGPQNQYTINSSSFKSLALIILVLIIWELIWKGFALWKAARNKQPVWFVVMLVLNTAGILEIIYIFLVPPKNDKKKNHSRQSDKELTS